MPLDTKNGGPGRPKGSKTKFSLKSLEEAISKVEKKYKKEFFVHVVERAYECDQVLIVLLKKLIPDQVKTTIQIDEELLSAKIEFADIPGNGDGFERFKKFVN